MMPVVVMVTGLSPLASEMPLEYELEIVLATQCLPSAPGRPIATSDHRRTPSLRSCARIRSRDNNEKTGHVGKI